MCDGAARITQTTNYMLVGHQKSTASQVEIAALGGSPETLPHLRLVHLVTVKQKQNTVIPRASIRIGYEEVKPHHVNAARPSSAQKNGNLYTHFIA